MFMHVHQMEIAAVMAACLICMKPKPELRNQSRDSLSQVWAYCVNVEWLLVVISANQTGNNKVDSQMI